MAKTSDAAKAASILHHTWGIDGYDRALEVYNTLGRYPEINVEEYLASMNAGRWAELDMLTEYEWWENVEALALSIDAALAYFAAKEKQ